MLSSPSLCPLFPSTIHVCQLTAGEDRFERVERRQSNDDNGRRRIYGNMDMPLNSSRLPLNPNHIATQMRERCDSTQTETVIPFRPAIPLRRSSRALQYTPPALTTRTPTPPPRDISPPHRRRHPGRRNTSATVPLSPHDTRRHGIILPDWSTSSSSSSSSTPTPDELPSYTPLLFNPHGRVATSGTISDPIDARTIAGRQSRQRELAALQHQWHLRSRRRRQQQRRETHSLGSSSSSSSSSSPSSPSSSSSSSSSWHSAPEAETERTHFRALVSEAYDLPPPYAALDPFPIWKEEEDGHDERGRGSKGGRRRRTSSLLSRVVLFPFLQDGAVLGRAAAGEADRIAAKVRFEVKKGVEGVGKRARAVPGKIEGRRARAKIRWLEERGWVDVDAGAERRERVGCSAYRGAHHAVEA